LSTPSPLYYCSAVSIATEAAKRVLEEAPGRAIRADSAPKFRRSGESARLHRSEAASRAGECGQGARHAGARAQKNEVSVSLRKLPATIDNYI